VKIPTPEACGWKESPASSTDWRSAFQHFCAALGGAMVSGDALWLIARYLRGKAGEEIAKEFLHHVFQNRPSFDNDFMGEFPRNRNGNEE
jgi:hypothetical protein